MATEIGYLSFLVAVGFIVAGTLNTDILCKFGAVFGVPFGRAAILALLAFMGGTLINNDAYRQATHAADLSLGLSVIPHVGPEDLARLTQSGARLIDVRYSRDYEEAHIPGARSIPVDSGLGSLEAKMEGVPRDVVLILYCQTERCMFSRYSTVMLFQLGFQNVRILSGGFESWKRSTER
ncbi:MAG: rhodanese-like domain-containing protein [Planctomycetaceae bacterium]|nr:rhodanese-like domain-containing protein [Planctomycetaceae bacterium]